MAADCPDPAWRGTPELTPGDLTAPDCPPDATTPVLVPPAPPYYGLTIYVVGGVSYLGVYLGCSLKFDAVGRVAVDAAQLVGNRTSTGLVVGPDFLLCPTVSNDYAVARTETQTVNISDATVSACCVDTRTRVDVTNTYSFNAANELIFWSAAAPVTTVTTVDFCLKVQCCAARTLGAEISLGEEVTLPFGHAPATFDFFGNGVDGVGPYTYRWDFGDAGSGVANISTDQNPSHEYANPGRYVVDLTVTDACGCTATDTYIVYVVWEPCACVFCPDGTNDTLFFEIAGGDGDFTDANGSDWVGYHAGLTACDFVADRNGWHLEFNVAETGASLATLTGPDGQVVRWTGAGCCGPGGFHFDSAVGTGTEPHLSDMAPLEPPLCPSCCRTYASPGTYTYTPDTTGTYVIGTWGAGGGGEATHDGEAGTGGGGGGYSKVTLTLNAGTGYTVVVGAGGITGFGAVPPGGASEFDDPVSGVLVRANGGNSGAASGNGAGASTVSAVGDVKFGGGDGAAETGISGGGGGSSASPAGAGVAASGTTGATAPAGGGNGGDNQLVGAAPGGGGGGANNGGSAGAGGAGKVRICLVS